MKSSRICFRRSSVYCSRKALKRRGSPEFSHGRDNVK
jgi:hypothetical protein